MVVPALLIDAMSYILVENFDTAELDVVSAPTVVTELLRSEDLLDRGSHQEASP